MLHSIHSVRTKHLEGTSTLVGHSTGILLEWGLHNVTEVHDRPLFVMQDSLVPAADQRMEEANDAFLVLLTMLLIFLALSACTICTSFKPRSATVKIAKTALVATCITPVSFLTDLSERGPNPTMVASIHLILPRSCQYSLHQRLLRILGKSHCCCSKRSCQHQSRFTLHHQNWFKSNWHAYRFTVDSLQRRRRSTSFHTRTNRRHCRGYCRILRHYCLCQRKIWFKDWHFSLTPE